MRRRVGFGERALRLAQEDSQQLAQHEKNQFRAAQLKRRTRLLQETAGIILGVPLILFIGYQISSAMPSLSPLLGLALLRFPALTSVVDWFPDVATSVLAMLGLTYMIPDFVKAIEQSSLLRRTLSGFLAFACFFTLIANQHNRDKTNQWQGDVVKGIDKIPSGLDRALKFLRLPNRIDQPESRSSASAGAPKAGANPVVATAPAISLPLPAGKIELELQNFIASSLGKEIRQDYQLAVDQADKSDQTQAAKDVEEAITQQHISKEDARRLIYTRFAGGGHASLVAARNRDISIRVLAEKRALLEEFIESAQAKVPSAHDSFSTKVEALESVCTRSTVNAEQCANALDRFATYLNPK
jgi:hypothetical protein